MAKYQPKHSASSKGKAYAKSSSSTPSAAPKHSSAAPVNNMKTVPEKTVKQEPVKEKPVETVSAPNPEIRKAEPVAVKKPVQPVQKPVEQPPVKPVQKPEEVLVQNPAPAEKPVQPIIEKKPEAEARPQLEDISSNSKVQSAKEPVNKSSVKKEKKEKLKKAKPQRELVFDEPEEKAPSKFSIAMRIIITAVFSMGIIFFLIPISKNYFTYTSVIAIVFCFIPILIVNLRGVITGHGRRIGAKIVMNIITFLYILAFAWFGFLSFQMFTVNYEDTSKDATVVVLGARVYQGGVSLALQNRLNTAADYLIDYPEANVVVTGGKGDNEPWSEASAERNYLISERKIDADRILLEDKSTSTEENLSFTKTVLAENKLGNEIVLVTQNYHMFRASSIAEDQGYVVYKRACNTNPLLFPTYYSRELLALTKYYITKII